MPPGMVEALRVGTMERRQLGAQQKPEHPKRRERQYHGCMKIDMHVCERHIVNTRIVNPRPTIDFRRRAGRKSNSGQMDTGTGSRRETPQCRARIGKQNLIVDLDVSGSSTTWLVRCT